MQRLHVGILKMSTAGYSGVASESIGDYHNPVKEMEDLGALRKETFASITISGWEKGLKYVASVVVAVVRGRTGTGAGLGCPKTSASIAWVLGGYP